MKKVLPLIIGAAIGVFVGIICGFILSLVDYFAPHYSILAHAIFNISMIVIFIIGFILIFCFIIGRELLFQLRLNKELTEHGYSPKLVEIFKKRKKKYEKNKYNMTYMQSVVFLANERLLYDDYESACKYLEEINLQEFYDKLRIGTGKAKLMDAYYFYVLIDLWIGYYYETNKPVEYADEIYNKFFKNSIGLYIDKNKLISCVNDEIIINYLFIKNDINKCESIIESLPNKFSENKAYELIFYRGLIVCDLKKNQLTIDSLNKYISEGRKLVDNSKLKVQFNQNYDQLYKKYSGLIENKGVVYEE